MGTVAAPVGFGLSVAGRADAFSLPGSEEPSHLWGSHCDVCGAYGFPPTRHCPRCSGTEVRRVPLSRRGKLHTWSTVYQNPGPSFMGETPYTIVTVDLPEGVRVVGTLSRALPPESLRHGLDVEVEVLELARDQQGLPLYDFRFRLA